MKKVLYFGDPHVMASNIDESDRLLDFVNATALKHKVDTIVILGDLFHTFSVLRVEVLNFWKDWLETLSVGCQVYVLVGNHDMKNQSDDDDKDHALEVFNLIKNNNLHVVQWPAVVGPFGFVPYIRDKSKFLEASNYLIDNYGIKTLIAHADWDGAQYENGFYCPDGVKQEDLKCDLIIGGHIHKRSRFGKIILPGTARWLNSSDKNEPKGLWLVEHNPETGSIVKEEFLDTSHVCTPIYAYQYKEGENCPEIPEGSRASVELIGSSEWIAREKPKFKGKASISSKITDKQKHSNRKASDNLFSFVDKFETIKGLKKERMIEFMKEMGIL